ncbi:hypothetical protein QMK11_01430 [Campylobacter jejuni]|nr:hypothetical protein QMK11_01430 [Campylobacter jejuni]
MFFNFKNKSSTKKEESKKVLEALYLQENELEEKLKNKYQTKINHRLCVVST